MAIFSPPNQSFRWLLAELTVVVLGILIAFQVDEFRAELGSTEQERQALIGMLADLSDDALSLERNIAQRNEKLPSLRRLIALLSDKATNQDDADEIFELETKFLLGGIGEFEPNITTFEKMQQSGQLSIIKDEQLYRQIIDYYQFNGINPFGGLQDRWLESTQAIIRRLYGSLFFIQSWELIDDSVIKYAPESEPAAPIYIDVESRKSDSVYLDYLGEIYQSQSYHESRWRRTLGANQQLQAAITQQLQ